MGNEETFTGISDSNNKGLIITNNKQSRSSWGIAKGIHSLHLEQEHLVAADVTVKDEQRD